MEIDAESAFCAGGIDAHLRDLVKPLDNNKIARRSDCAGLDADLAFIPTNSAALALIMIL